MSSKNIVERNGILAFHPGSYVEDIIEVCGITQEEFAIRLGVSIDTVRQLLGAEISISNDLAHSLSTLTGISTQTWINLQKKYDEQMKRIKKQSCH